MHPLILLLQLLVMKNAVQFVVLVHKSLFFFKKQFLFVSSSQSASCKGNVEHIQLQDHTELGASESFGE